ncbi:SymE family type I addiction module toxin [Affinibrenneria salicis]|uniref:hypothetical protein n=1 Tax=Affinibrenneria salicis TaxID=2590031 RepID=UPI00295E8D46|nr:hypothetical protein [Affinibrenneria salicis]
MAETGFCTGTGVILTVADGCIVLVLDSDEVDELKHETLRRQQRKIKQTNRDMKNATKVALQGNQGLEPAN